MKSLRCLPESSQARLQVTAGDTPEAKAHADSKSNPEPSKNPFRQARDFSGLHVEIPNNKTRLIQRNNPKLPQSGIIKQLVSKRKLLSIPIRTMITVQDNQVQKRPRSNRQKHSVKARPQSKKTPELSCSRGKESGAPFKLTNTNTTMTNMRRFLRSRRPNRKKHPRVRSLAHSSLTRAGTKRCSTTARKSPPVSKAKSPCVSQPPTLKTSNRHGTQKKDQGGRALPTHNNQSTFTHHLLKEYRLHRKNTTRRKKRSTERTIGPPSRDRPPSKPKSIRKSIFSCRGPNHPCTRNITT